MDGERSEAGEDGQTLQRASGIEKQAVSFSASLKRGWLYVKAYFTGQAKRLTAKTEQEASEAVLQEAKMQVEATDEAERRKNRVNKP